MNKLYFGDNLYVLDRLVEPSSIDLVYLDPPFNSKAIFNVLYETPQNLRETAQRTAFRDLWSWGEEAQAAYLRIQAQRGRIASVIEDLRLAWEERGITAYLVTMTDRLIQLHKVLKPTGSLYLHCDPTASHYLKIILDAIFGPDSFRNEVIWQRTSSHNSAKRYGRILRPDPHRSSSDGRSPLVRIAHLRGWCNR